MIGSARAPLLTPLQRTTADLVAERLVTALALGEYVPGQRLPSERELSGLLGASRGRVREALHRLADDEYLEIRKGRNGGAFVRSSWGPESTAMVRRTLLPQWQRLDQLLDLRNLLEPMTAFTAAERHDDGATAIVAALDAYRVAEDRDASAAADQAFHTAIARASHNVLLADLLHHIRGEISLGFQAEPYSADLRRQAVEQHGEIAEAIVQRRAADAAQAMSRHLSLTESALRSLVARVGGAAPAPGD